MYSAQLKYALAREFSTTGDFLLASYKETLMTGMRKALILSSHPRDAADEVAA